MRLFIPYQPPPPYFLPILFTADSHLIFKDNFSETFSNVGCGFTKSLNSKYFLGKFDIWLFFRSDHSLPMSVTHWLSTFWNWNNCVTRAPLLYFIRSWVALSFKVVSQSVMHAWHPSKSPLFAIYKGMNVLYWPSIINYQLLLPHSVLYWPSTQLHHLVTHSWANWI